MGKRNGKKNISEKLFKLIYNPDLSSLDWQAYPDHKKITLFRNLFLLLSEDFQKQYGKELEKHIKKFSIQEAQGETVLYGSWEYPICDKCPDEACSKPPYDCPYTLNNRIDSTPADFYFLLMRKEPKSITFSEVILSNAILEPYEKNSNKLLNDLPKKDFKKYLKRLENHAIKNFKEYYTSCREGYIPPEIYYVVDVTVDKEILLEAFKRLIEQKQELYFKQHPNEKHPERGHFRKYKEDKRKHTYPYETWERYFKVHVLSTLNKDTIREIYPQHINKYSIPSLINQDRKKAENLIKNAWIGNFPGKY